MIEQNTLTTADIARGEEAPRENREEAVREENGNAPLQPASEAQDFRAKWERTQAAFVDEPRNSVEEADQLVASAMKRLAEVFADERAKLEREWDRGDSVSTEDLRIALRRYRSFFDRLLSV